MRYARVKVTRDTNTVHNRAVPEWEIPILELIFEEGNVSRTEQFEKVEGEYPDANNEFARLVAYYGTDAESKTPFAAMVYGNGNNGVRNLRKQIEIARTEEDEASEQEASEPSPTRAPTKRTRATAESLLA